ncbi:hypothetical protein EVAR_66448_1 [Eumeta japonica]|uniref:Uncharacterized protein n=1 Tax=Eumeta variegata TaxID=151549 RepID=A0A4C2A586_EUMVA|nr:hypothetical protein EVAR_66448_1 [Eumeta japonica]
MAYFLAESGGPLQPRGPGLQPNQPIVAKGSCAVYGERAGCRAQTFPATSEHSAALQILCVFRPQRNGNVTSIPTRRCANELVMRREDSVMDMPRGLGRSAREGAVVVCASPRLFFLRA